LRAKKAKTGLCISDDEPQKVSQEDQAEAQRLANAFQIDAQPATGRRHPRKTPLRLADPDEVAFWTGRDPKRPRKSPTSVCSVTGRRELETILAHLRATIRSHDSAWAYLDKPDELAEHGSPLVFAAAVGDRCGPQGIFACARSVTVLCYPDATTINYRIHGGLIYVDAAARKRGLGSALIAATAMCVQEDLEQLCRIWRATDTPAAILAWISGDAYSLGGERAFQSLYDIACLTAEMAEGVPIEVEPDWSV